jgi:hypothetical protein
VRALIGSIVEVRFRPESEQPALTLAAAEYQRLWEAQGDRVVEQLAAATGLRFAETVIDAIVFEGMSQSSPLRLRASYDRETKLATLIHELAHRLVQGHAGPSVARHGTDRQRQSHELINLFLFDVWADLYGDDFARRHVDVESQRRSVYREAWHVTLELDRASRAEKLRSLLSPSTRPRSP